MGRVAADGAVADAVEDAWAMSDDLDPDWTVASAGGRGGAGAGTAGDGSMALMNGAHVPCERLPMLEIVLDRLERILPNGMRNLTSEAAGLELDPIGALRLGDCLDPIPMPAMIAIFRAVEGNGLDPRLAAIVRTDNACLAVKPRIELADRGGTIERLVPHATHEPIRPMLRQIDVADIELLPVIDELTVGLDVVPGLAVGNMLRLGDRAEDPVIPRCGRVPTLRGRAIQRAGWKAVRTGERAAHDGEPYDG